jgi:hypothetical protein
VRKSESPLSLSTLNQPFSSMIFPVKCRQISPRLISNVFSGVSTLFWGPLVIFPENHGGNKKASQIIGETIGDFPKNHGIFPETHRCVWAEVSKTNYLVPENTIVAANRCAMRFCSWRSLAL